jgi:short subunit dehydrogenase-like uncharacterized protein
LDEIATELNKPEIREMATIIADAADDEALHAMAARTQVVLSTTGPFWK